MFRTVAFACAAVAFPAIALAAPTASTTDYMTKAGQSDQFEIQSGKLAEKNAGSAMVKQIGRRMVTDHTKSTKLVMAAAKKSGLPTSPPPELTSDQQSMLSDLGSKHGADFDKTYVADQMTAHQQALDLHQAYAASGQDAHLKAAAKQIVPVVKSHIAMLKKMS